MRALIHRDIILNIEQLDFQLISPERRLKLQPIIKYIGEKQRSVKNICLNFICTHNSRRSVFSQVWAECLAKYYGIADVVTYSGGTESTKIYDTILYTLQQQGFGIEVLTEDSNPVYAVRYSDVLQPIVAFSKKYDSFYNPKSHFGAILTCSEADADCPIVLGCETRISLPYEDPKIADGTSDEAAKYLERSTQIATELAYVFQTVAENKEATLPETGKKGRA